MKRNLQESKNTRRVIYEGNGFCKVMEGSELVERIQLERGDNLMEAIRPLKEAKSVKLTSSNPMSSGSISVEANDDSMIRDDLEYVTAEEGVTVATINQRSYSEAVIAHTDNFGTCKSIASEVVRMAGSCSTIEDFYALFPITIKGVRVEIYSE